LVLRVVEATGIDRAAAPAQLVSPRDALAAKADSGVPCPSHRRWMFDPVPRRSLGEKGAGRSLHPFLYDQFDSNPAGFPLGERYTTGAPLGRPTGNDDVGNELDLIAQYNVNQNLSVEAGYFWFW
jgi:hypothetical protein